MISELIGRYFADTIFEHIFLYRNIWNSNKMSMEFSHKGQLDNESALLKVIAWYESACLVLLIAIRLLKKRFIICHLNNFCKMKS